MAVAKIQRRADSFLHAAYHHPVFLRQEQITVWLPIPSQVFWDHVRSPLVQKPKRLFCTLFNRSASRGRDGTSQQEKINIQTHVGRPARELPVDKPQRPTLLVTDHISVPKVTLDEHLVADGPGFFIHRPYQFSQGMIFLLVQLE